MLDVAVAAGFESQEAFARAFKKLRSESERICAQKALEPRARP
ncbi:MAG: hypothetical protein AAGA81_08325 [Acidobacteriota bacterium]